MPGAAFDDLADVYEALIDWPRRLANEGPFFRRWFQAAAASRVADVACGTGHHAAMFHSWGLEVEGADLNPEMIRRCRERFGEPAGLRWAVRGFDAPRDPVAPEEIGTFDAVVCVGNSLALVPDAATVRQSLQQMLAALAPGGVLLVQVLNLWRLADGPCLWQKCRRATLPDKMGTGSEHGDVRAAGDGCRDVPVPILWDALLVKGVHRAGQRGYVELLVADPAGQRPLRGESVPLVGLEAADLADMARAAGARELNFFGDYQEQPYNRAESVDLIMVARK